MSIKLKIKPWSIKSSKYIIADQWIKVRADECRTDSGLIIAPYYVIEYCDWVQVAAFDAQMRILINYEYRHGHRKIRPQLPGGRVDHAGESPLVTIKRELLEETGYTSDRFEKVGEFSPNTATHTNQVHCYLANDIRKIAEPQLDDGEEIESELIEINELIKYIDNGEFDQALHISHIFLALRHLGLVDI